MAMKIMDQKDNILLKNLFQKFLRKTNNRKRANLNFVFLKMLQFSALKNSTIKVPCSLGSRQVRLR